MCKVGDAIQFSRACSSTRTVEDVVVSVGDVLSDCRFPPSLRYAETVRVIDWRALVVMLSNGTHPTVICSAAMSGTIDCMDIALLLQRFSYTGHYRIVAHDLPDPAVVQRDINSAFPELDVEVVSSPPRTLISLS